MTLAEAADFLRLAPQTLRHKMCHGELVQGVHYFKRQGMAPRFKRTALEAFIEGRDDDVIPMAARRRAREHNGL